MTSGNAPAHDPYGYPPVAVTVDVVLFTIREGCLHVLLVERGGEPYLGCWALPGGFVTENDSSLERAAERELEEETDVPFRAAWMEQLGSYGDRDRDLRQRVVTVVYWGACADPPEARGDGDAAVASFLRVEFERTPDGGASAVVRAESGDAVELAFDHARILDDALNRLYAKLEYTAVAAAFCGPEFTITELRQVYEAIWNATLDAANFQRKVRGNGAFRQLKRLERSRRREVLRGRRRPAPEEAAAARMSVEPPPDPAPPAEATIEEFEYSHELREEDPSALGRASMAPAAWDEAPGLLPARAPAPPARFSLRDAPEPRERPLRAARPPRKGRPPSWWTADDPSVVLDSIVSRPGRRG